LERFCRFRYYLTVDSTNARAVDDLHMNDALGTSFVTESQHEGRGRAGRRWYSPAGAGIYCTTVLPQELDNGVLPAVGFWASRAVVCAVDSALGVELDLKWPNDLVLRGRKCCGILTEGRSSGAANRVAVGVGLNVNRPELAPPEGASGAGWLSDALGRAIDRTQLLARILAEYESSFDALVADPALIIRDWAERARIKGRRLSVKSADGTVLREGVARGLEADGALILETKDGLRTVRLGDVDAL